MKSINALLAEKFKDQNFEKKYHRSSTLFRLADEVLLLRKKRGLTQKELAAKVETTQAVVSRLENATVKPSLETILKIAEALGAVVEVRLVPMEELQKDVLEDSTPHITQKQIDVLDKIINLDEIKNEEKQLTWIEPEKFSNLLGISNRPLYRPITKSRKIRELA